MLLRVAYFANTLLNVYTVNVNYVFFCGPCRTIWRLGSKTGVALAKTTARTRQ